MNRIGSYKNKIFVVTIITLEIVSLVVLYTINNKKSWTTILSIIIFAIFYIISNLKLKKAIENLLQKQIEEEKGKYLELSLILEKKRSLELEEEQRYAEYLYNDLKKRIINAKNSIKNKEEIDTAEKKLSDAVIFKASKNIYCANPIIDAVVSSKTKEANAYGINISVDLNIPIKEILSSSELCAVFSNILDNAINACHEVEKDKKTISLISKETKEYWVITCSNPYAKKVNSKKDKTNLRNHGWGLEIINDIVYRHNGEMKIDYSDDVFSVKLFFLI